MTNEEFNKVIRQKNIEYRNIFGYIPCITDYSCSREQYIAAMNHAIIENRELGFYLQEYTAPIKPGAEI